MINSALKDNGVPAFPVVVVSWTLPGRDDGDMLSIHRSCTLKKAKVMPKAVNNLPQSSTSWKSYVMRQQTLYDGRTHPSTLNKRLIWKYRISD